MNEADAQRLFATRTDYEMKRKRRQLIIDRITEPEAKRRRLRDGIDHNATKEQQQLVSVQLIEGIEKWESSARSLLAMPNNGVPTISEIRNMGRRVQDKKNLEVQVQQEKEKSNNLTREVQTVEMMREAARTTELSNERIRRLCEERLELRAKLTEMSFQKYWKEMKAPEGEVQFKYAWSAAQNCFSLFTSVVHVPDDWEGPRNKTDALKRIGTYLTRAKLTAKMICEYVYGKKGTDAAVAKRERLVEPADVLEMMGFIDPTRMQTQAGRDEDSAARVMLASVVTVDPHYAYTSRQNEAENDQSNQSQVENDGDSSDDDSDDDMDDIGGVEDDERPRLVSIS
jgi:hypothetical protein